MTIGIVLSSLPGYSETFFRNKVRVLQENGFKVILFTSFTRQKSDLVFRKGPAEFKSYPVLFFISVAFVLCSLLVKVPRRAFRLIRLEKKDGNGVGKIVKTLYYNSHVLKSNLDWVHFGFATQALEKENLAAAMEAKMAVSFRGYDINVYPMKYPNTFNNLWTKVNKVHSISESLYQKALHIGLPENIAYEKITPAIDLALFDAVKRSYFDGGKIRITTIARLTWIKGLDYAIHAMKILANQGVDFEYQIVGEGVLYDRICFAIYQMGLNNQVKLSGKKDSREIREILNETDVYLQPSLEEGFCNAVLEAQACQCLCIVSKVGGLTENIIDGITGWYVPVRDPEAIAKKIVEVSDLPGGDIDKIIHAAKERINSEFSLEHQKQKFIRFYE